MEILVEGAGDRVETVEVVACLVLVAARGVEVVHQYVTLFAVELEYARPLDGCLARIGVQIDEILLPRAAQRRGGGLLYAVLHFAALVVLGVALVEEMPRAVLVDDVVVDGAVFGAEEHLRLGLEAAEVVDGVLGKVASQALVGVILRGDLPLRIAAGCAQQEKQQHQSRQKIWLFSLHVIFLLILHRSNTTAKKYFDRSHPYPPQHRGARRIRKDRYKCRCP